MLVEPVDPKPVMSAKMLNYGTKAVTLNMYSKTNENTNSVRIPRPNELANEPHCKLGVTTRLTVYPTQKRRED